MQQFDVTLKSLLSESAARITGEDVVRWLPTELPVVQNLNVDLLGETGSGELVQIELQTVNDPKMPFRMLRYFVSITAVRGRIPRQIVLYAGKDALSMPNEFRWPNGHIRFTVIDLRTLDGNALLESPETSDNILALLARLRDPGAAIRRVLKKLSYLPVDEAKRYSQALLVVAGLRGWAKTAYEEAKTVLTIDLSDNEVLGPAYRQGRQEGRQEGREEGREEGQRAALAMLIEQRLGGLPQEIEEKLTALSTEEVHAALIRVLEAKTITDLFPEQ